MSEEEKELETRRNLTKQVKRLERKLRETQKSEEAYRKRWQELYDFENAFIRFYSRFKDRKYDSEWPVQRVTEALLHLRGLLK